jgi:hypothetical protein
MYQNPYMQNFNNNPYGQQSLNDRIDTQIAQLNQMKEQIKNQQPTNLTQNFQLAPTHQAGMRYASTIDDVGKEVVYADTPFFSKDMSVVWIKNNKGDIKTYELKEIIPLDSKDMQIQYLQSQIEELKGMIKNDANVTNDASKQNATDTSKLDESDGNEFKESKSSSVSKISRSKKE